jgi:hypothetical protein
MVRAAITVSAAAPPPGRKSTTAARARMIATFRIVWSTTPILGQVLRLADAVPARPEIAIATTSAM